jgi:hypothetical protein
MFSRGRAGNELSDQLEKTYLLVRRACFRRRDMVKLYLTSLIHSDLTIFQVPKNRMRCFFIQRFKDDRFRDSFICNGSSKAGEHVAPLASSSISIGFPTGMEMEIIIRLYRGYLPTATFMWGSRDIYEDGYQTFFNSYFKSACTVSD